MFNSVQGILFFLVGLVLTIGLLLTPTCIPGGWGYKMGLHWSVAQMVLSALLGLGLLAGVLWVGGRWMKGVHRWNEPRALAAMILIAAVGNVVYMCLVDWFGLQSGWRALIAVMGVPVIYGNIGRVLGKSSLKAAMLNIVTGALATMGAAFIFVAIIKGW